MKLFKVALLTLSGAALVAGAPFAVKYFYPSKASGVAVSGSSTSVLPEPGRAKSQAGTKMAPVAHAIKDLPTPSSVALAVIATPAPRAKAESPAVTAAQPAKPTYEVRPEVAKAQEHLNALGVAVGTADGKLGPKTKAAISEFQKNNGIAVTGDVDAATLDKIASAVKEKEAKQAAEAASQIAAAAPVAQPSAPAAPATLAVSAPAGAAATADPQFVVLKKPEIQVSQAPTDPGPVPSLTTVKDVMRIQERLTAAGTYSGAVDGKWGELSRNALKDFQQKAGLPATGKPDKKTWLAMNESPRGSWDELDRGRQAVEVALASRPQTTDVRIETAIDSRMQAKDGTSDAPAGLAAAAKLAAEAAAASARASREPEPAVSVTPDQVKAAESSEIRKLVGAGAVSAPEAAAAAPATEKAPEAEPVAALPPPPVEPIAEVKMPTEEPKLVASIPEPAAAPSASIEIKPSAEPKSLEVSEPAAQPGAPAENPEAKVAPGEQVVIRMNADAGPGSAAPVATPASVSPALTGSIGGQEAAQIAMAEEPKAAPDPFAPTPAAGTAEQKEPKADAQPAPSNAAAGEAEFATLPPLGGAAKKADAPTKENKISNTARLRLLEEQIEETQARVAMVSNDTRYEVEKYASSDLRQIQSLLSKAKSGAGKGDAGAEEVREALRKADAELEAVKRECLKRKGAAAAADIEKAYDNLRERFADEIKREPLASTMAKVDIGFAAMKKDFKAGNYDPIVERAPGFLMTIESLTNDAAKAYLEASLKSSSVKKKLSKKDLDAIERLRGQEKYGEAAELLQGKTASRKASSTKDRS